MGDGRSVEEYRLRRSGTGRVGDDGRVRPDGKHTVVEHLATIAPTPRKRGLSVGPRVPSDLAEK